jgi:hypothetical protein
MSSVRSSELEPWPSARAARHRLVSLLAQTWLVPPRLKSDVILRPHLLEQLNAGLDARRLIGSWEWCRMNATTWRQRSITSPPSSPTSTCPAHGLHTMPCVC